MTASPATGRPQRRPTRRAILGGGLGAGLGIMLAGCSSGSQPTVGPAAEVTGPPQRGGELRVGFVGGGAADTLDGMKATNLGDIARAINLYDALIGRGDEYEMFPAVAESFVPNDDATVWTATLREGIKFSDGRPVTGADVKASIERILNPDDPGNDAAGLAAVDEVVPIDDRTVEFRLSTPDSVLNEAVAQYTVIIVPADFDPANPVGTGPFKLESFTPGLSTQLVRNEHYWGEGPYVDEVTLLNFNDTDALINALLSTQVDAVAQIPTSLIDVIGADARMRILNSETGMWMPFTMRVDQEPFDDERVRQAFRLAIDRQEMIDQVLSGQGRIANDMYSIDDPEYPSHLPQREQDLERAKQLLAEAGYPDGIDVELVTAPIQSGVVEAAQVFAEQAKGAGIRVDINRLDLTAYWSNYLEYPFSQSFWNTKSFLTQTTAGTLPNAPFNESHWDDPKFIDICAQARAEANEEERTKLIQQAQEILYDRGGLIIWGFANQVDAYQAYLGGLRENATGMPLSGFNLHRVWIGDIA